MNKRFQQSLTIGALLFSLLCTTTTQAQKTVPPSAELSLLKTWFAGEFDNFQQVYKEREDKKDNVHDHIHSIFQPVNLPAFGQHVFYVLQYLDGDSTKVYRQRIYSFNDDKNEKAIRLDIYSFAVDSPFYYAHQKPEKLNGLTPAQMTTMEGCAVFWKKTGNQFIGYMKPNACHFLSKRSGKKIFITDSLLLTPDAIWINDQATDENGNYVFGHKEKIPHQLKRCRFYKGWILLQKAGLTDEYHAMRGLLWHDQGKRNRLYLENGTATKYEVELAAVVYGKDLEVLKLAVYEVGNSKAVAYTWATPGSKNIGVNMRWIQSGLTKLGE
jgi:hypothetical protein